MAWPQLLQLHGYAPSCMGGPQFHGRASAAWVGFSCMDMASAAWAWPQLRGWASAAWVWCQLHGRASSAWVGSSCIDMTWASSEGLSCMRGFQLHGHGPQLHGYGISCMGGLQLCMDMAWAAWPGLSCMDGPELHGRAWVAWFGPQLHGGGLSCMGGLQLQLLYKHDKSHRCPQLQDLGLSCSWGHFMASSAWLRGPQLLQFCECYCWQQHQPVNSCCSWAFSANLYLSCVSAPNCRTWGCMMDLFTLIWSVELRGVTDTVHYYSLELQGRPVLTHMSHGWWQCEAVPPQPPWTCSSTGIRPILTGYPYSPLPSQLGRWVSNGSVKISSL